MKNKHKIVNILELANNPYSDRNYDIDIIIPEFTCVCPKTGQPDFAKIKINYVPDKFIVELKSLKLYLQQYRGFGGFHEEVSNKIFDDFKKTCNPKKIIFVGKFNARGGISTDVTVSWPQ